MRIFPKKFPLRRSGIHSEWLVSLRVAQFPDGSLPGIVPTAGWGAGFGPAWDGAIVELPYRIWLYTGEIFGVKTPRPLRGKTHLSWRTQPNNARKVQRDFRGKQMNTGRINDNMTNVKIDFNHTIGVIKPMHAVNNGPIEASQVEQSRGNSIDYQAAGFAYARTHDSTTCGHYGGPHAVDIIAIFPDFKNNPYDEDSYDFDLTDDYLNSIERAGTHVFFRFGATIEHERKKYGTKVPADFHQFAIVCEHIIRHYNEGWANGFHLGIEYWEIWNEPDGKTPDGDQPNWSGTAQEYYEMYSVTAKHLKKRFPDLKIGGPAVSGLNMTWITGFLDYLTADCGRAPLDFFSWHSYTNDPDEIRINAECVRGVLDKYGYKETESILD